MCITHSVFVVWISNESILQCFALDKLKNLRVCCYKRQCGGVCAIDKVLVYICLRATYSNCIQVMHRSNVYVGS